MFQYAFKSCFLVLNFTSSFLHLIRRTGGEFSRQQFIYQTHSAISSSTSSSEVSSSLFNYDADESINDFIVVEND
jgi:hypothetical protein